MTTVVRTSATTRRQRLRRGGRPGPSGGRPRPNGPNAAAAIAGPYMGSLPSVFGAVIRQDDGVLRQVGQLDFVAVLADQDADRAGAIVLHLDRLRGRVDLVHDSGQELDAGRRWHHVTPFGGGRLQASPLHPFDNRWAQEPVAPERPEGGDRRLRRVRGLVRPAVLPSS